MSNSLQIFNIFCSKSKGHFVLLKLETVLQLNKRIMITIYTIYSSSCNLNLKVLIKMAERQ